MTTTWNIFDTQSQIADGVITRVTYGCIVQLDNCIDRTINNLDLVGDPSSEGFVSYENLTEGTILQWVKSSIGQEQVTAIETSLQNNVTAQKAAKDAETIKSGLPWRN